MATLLIVDDDNGLVRALQVMFEEDGHHVMCAANGKNALEQMALHKPQLILCDIIMPIMDGWSFLSAIKGHSDFKDVPVVMLSAYDDDSERIRSLALQAEGMISKRLAFRVIRIQVKKTLIQLGLHTES